MSFASTGNLSALSAHIPLQQTGILPIQNDLAENSSIPLPYLKTDFFEDIFMMHVQNDTTSHTVDCSVSPNGSQDFVLHDQHNLPPRLELDMQVGINGNFDSSVLSPTQSIPFPVSNDAQNPTTHLGTSHLEFVWAANVQDDGSAVYVSQPRGPILDNCSPNTQDPICGGRFSHKMGTSEKDGTTDVAIDRVEQHDMIKDALLRDIQEHCNRRRGSQSEELVRAFRRLLSLDRFSIYPEISGTNDRGVPSLTRAFAFDCIEGKADYIDKHQRADGSIGIF